MVIILISFALYLLILTKTRVYSNLIYCYNFINSCAVSLSDAVSGNKKIEFLNKKIYIRIKKMMGCGCKRDKDRYV